jgi:predicted site-specific integrase-resolvase
MPEKKVTINSLLTTDRKKRLVELLLSEDIQNMVVVFRDKDDFRCETSEEAIATTIGMLDMAKKLVIEDWFHPDIHQDDGQVSED